MKTKNNLDMFMSEILYMMKYRKIKMKDVMMEIYVRETGNETRCVEHMLKWFADVPRETLELDEVTYHFINEYYSVLLEDTAVNIFNRPIEWYTGLKTLLRMEFIPSKYSQMPLNDFMKIIRLKKES